MEVEAAISKIKAERPELNIVKVCRLRDAGAELILSTCVFCANGPFYFSFLFLFIHAHIHTQVASGSMVTRDFRLDRVRVWYDPETGVVEGAPKVG